MSYKKRSSVAGVIVLAILSPQALAGGYQISERSAASLGRAFAGEAAISEDASTIASNPAGMAFLKKPSFSLAGSILQGELKVDIEESTLVVPGLAQLGLQSSFPTQGTRSAANASEGSKFIPAAYAVYPINESIAVGLGAFSNFASETEYDSSFAGAILAESSKITTLNINPSLSWKVNDLVALGFGLNAVRGEALLGSANPGVGYVRTPDGLGFATDPINNELILAPNGSSLGSVEIAGEAWGYGWNFGVISQPLAGTSLGFAYRSEVAMDLEGEATFQGTPQVDNFVDFAAKAPLELPAILSLSAAQDLGAGLRLSADISQTRWSNFKKLEIFRKDNGALSSQVDQEWRDSNRYAIGLDYALSPALTLRTDGAFDQSPVPNRTRTLRIPTSDLRWYTAGGTYKFSDRASLDLGLALIRMSHTGIDDTRTFVGQAFQAKLKASSSLEAQVLSTQLNIAL